MEIAAGIGEGRRGRGYRSIALDCQAREGGREGGKGESSGSGVEAGRKAGGRQATAPTADGLLYILPCDPSNGPDAGGRTPFQMWSRLGGCGAERTGSGGGIVICGLP